MGGSFARQDLFDEWKEASISKLDSAAHQIDMRWTKPREWIEMFNETWSIGRNYAIQECILNLSAL